MGVDHHGSTTTHSVNAFTAVEQARRMDPYGNPRGTAPQTWPGQQGFVGGIHDPTGLIPLCAPDAYSICADYSVKGTSTVGGSRALLDIRVPNKMV